MSEQEDRGDRAMTTAMLKAFANPLRRRILQVFAAREFVRAADVADVLGEPANKVSFHLRVMADAGLIVEAPEKARDRRDRVWTPVRGAFTVGSPEHPVADETLGNAVLVALAEDHIELVRRVATWSAEYIAGRAAEDHATFSRHSLRLTPEEYRELNETLHQLILDAEKAHDRDAADVRTWQLDIVAADDTI